MKDYFFVFEVPKGGTGGPGGHLRLVHPNLTKAGSAPGIRRMSYAMTPAISFPFRHSQEWWNSAARISQAGTGQTGHGSRGLGMARAWGLRREPQAQSTSTRKTKYRSPHWGALLSIPRIRLSENILTFCFRFRELWNSKGRSAH